MVPHWRNRRSDANKEAPGTPSWRVAILKDTSKPMLGLHGLHVAFRGLPNVEVVAHVDSNSENIQEKMAYTQARRHYTDYLEMLDKERPDIVVLCSRHPGDHFPQISAAAERGCHVYCEKPMTADLREADHIARLVEQHRIKLCVAHPARYAPAYLTMKKKIDAGEIGTPLTAAGRGKCDSRGGGEDLMVLGTHILDLEAFLFGDPQRVWADVKTEGRPIIEGDLKRTLEPIGPAAGEDIFACINFANGVRGTFESRRGLPGISEGIVQMGLTVVGSHGVLSMRFNDAAAPVCRLLESQTMLPLENGKTLAEVPWIETRTLPGAEPLDESLRGKPDIPWGFFLEANRFAAWDLMGAIEEDRQPVSNAFTARTTLEMIYGIYASSLAKKEITFPLADRTHPLTRGRPSPEEGANELRRGP